MKIKALAFSILLIHVSPAFAQRADPGYRLGPEDAIEITIYGPTNTIVKSRIKSNGQITLPFIGNIDANGQTAQDLGELIGRKLKASGFYTNPIVNIEVSAYASQSVTVLGQVGTPGIFPLDHPQTLGEMIARVGGLKAGASDRVSVRHEGSSQVESYSIVDIAKNAQKDISLKAGDVIFVGEEDHFYIYGQVGAAGSYPIQPNMTVRQGLARAGGPTLAGSEKKIVLYRGGQEVNVELTEPLRSDDVLFVKERAF